MDRSSTKLTHIIELALSIYSMSSLAILPGALASTFSLRSTAVISSGMFVSRAFTTVQLTSAPSFRLSLCRMDYWPSLTTLWNTSLSSTKITSFAPVCHTLTFRTCTAIWLARHLWAPLVRKDRLTQFLWARSHRFLNARNTKMLEFWSECQTTSKNLLQILRMTCWCKTFKKLEIKAISQESRPRLLNQI